MFVFFVVTTFVVFCAFEERVGQVLINAGAKPSRVEDLAEGTSEITMIGCQAHARIVVPDLPLGALLLCETNFVPGGVAQVSSFPRAEIVRVASANCLSSVSGGWRRHRTRLGYEGNVLGLRPGRDSGHYG